MIRKGWLLPLCLLPVACAAPLPAGPSVLAVPGKDKSFTQFQQDEGSCRDYAQGQIGPTSPSQAATQSAVGSAVVGTALGTAAGALIGSTVGAVGAGAAIGAASGLAVGAGVGSANAGLSAGALQQRYDFSYIQCMSAKGDNIQAPPAPVYGYAAPYGYPYPYPAYAYGPGYGYPVVVGGPVVGFGFGRYGYWRR
jgi:hypothetical protein